MHTRTRTRVLVHRQSDSSHRSYLGFVTKATAGFSSPDPPTQTICTHKHECRSIRDDCIPLCPSLIPNSSSLSLTELTQDFHSWLSELKAGTEGSSEEAGDVPEVSAQLQRLKVASHLNYSKIQFSFCSSFFCNGAFFHALYMKHRSLTL